MGQVVEQLGVRGRLPLRSEVLARRHEPGAEDLLPEPVHGHPGGQGVGVVDEPPRETEAVAGQRLLHRRQGRGRARENPLAALVVHPALEHVGRRLAVHPLLHHVGDAAAPPHLAPLVVHRPAPGLELAVRLVVDAQIAQPQDVALGHGQTLRRLDRRPPQRPPLGNDLGLLDREGAVEHAEVGDAPAREVAGLEHPAVDGVAPAQVERLVGDDAALRPGEELAALLLDPLAVLVDVQPAALPRPVVGEHDVGPLAGRHALGVDGPDAGAGRRAALVALARQPEVELPRAQGHRPPARAVLLVVLAGHDEVALVLGLVDPHRDRERRVGVEVQGRQLDPRLAVEAQGGMTVGTVLDGHAGLERYRVPLALVHDGGAGGVVEGQRQQLRLRLERRHEGAVLAAGHPLDEVGVHRHRALVEPGVELGRLVAQLVPEPAVGVVGHHEDGRRVGDVAVHDVLGGVPEERGHRVELALRDGVELVVVAGGAADGQAEEDVADGLGPVLGVDRLVLLRHHPALVGGDVVALKAGGHELVEARLGQEVAGHLLDDEVVEGLVLVERPDRPVAPREHLAVVVDVDAVGVAVAGRVEPVAGAVLAPVPRPQQPVDEGLVGVVRGVVQVGREEARIGRQPRQVEGRPAGQGALVGLGRRGQPLGLEPRENEAVDGVARPRLVGHRRGRVLGDGFERPVLVPRRALVDPAGQHVDLPGRQPLVGQRRGRHPQPFVGVGDALVQQARPGVAGHDGGTARARPERPVPRVEPQPRLARALVGPVAREAVVGQNRPHVALEVDGGGQRGRRRLGGEAGRGGRQQRRGAAGRGQDESQAANGHGVCTPRPTPAVPGSRRSGKTAVQ